MLLLVFLPLYQNVMVVIIRVHSNISSIYVTLTFVLYLNFNGNRFQ